MEANAYRSVRSRYGELTVFANDTGAATQSLLTYGEWAENEIAFLHHFVTSGSTVVDVGAYIGTHTLALGQFVGETGRVVAIEAQPHTFELLRKNVQANLSAEARSGVDLKNVIASHESAQLLIPSIDVGRESSFGSASLVNVLINTHRTPTNNENLSDHSALLPAITLDSLDLPNCALIKIDVEGVENLVLRGAVETLERCSPIVYCECNSLAGGLKSMDVLKSAGYKILAHVVDAFNTDNFFRVHENIFGNAREVALVGFPTSCEAKVRNVPLRACELLLEIEDADDLALALLNKPQYQGEVLRRSHAALTGGVEFLDHYDASRQELNRLQRENAFLQRTYTQERRALEEQIQSVAQFHALLAQRDADIASLQRLVEQGNREASELRGLLSRRDTEIAELYVLMTQRHIDVSVLRDLVSQGEREISQLRDLLTERDANLAQLAAQGTAKDAELARANALMSALHASKSWKITKPLRWGSKQTRGVHDKG